MLAALWFPAAQLLKGALQVHRLGVVDHGRDALLLERVLHPVALLAAFQNDGVLRPAGIKALRDHRGLDDVAQVLGVQLGRAVDILQLMLPEGLEFDLQHRRLNGIQTGVDADTDVVVLADRALAVDAQRAQQLG